MEYEELEKIYQDWLANKNCVDPLFLAYCLYSVWNEDNNIPEEELKEKAWWHYRLG